MTGLFTFWRSLPGIRGNGRRATSRRPLRRSLHSPHKLALEPLEERVLLAAVGLPGTAGFESLVVDVADYEPSRILVRFHGEAVNRGPAAALAGTRLGRAFPIVSGLREITLTENVSVEAALAHYRAQPDVVYAQPDYRLHLALTPNDPKYTDGTLWGLHNTGQNSGTADADIDAPEAWDITTGSTSTIVAVIDTGVDYNHSDLAANMWRNPVDPIDGFDNDGNGFVDDFYGADFVNNDGDPMDDHYHGTHVAGTIGGVGNNGAGVVGVNWNVQIMALKFLNAAGSGTTSGAIAALNYAVAHGAKISNNSYGGGPFEQAMFDAIQSAAQQGHLFVAAAGNGNFLGWPQDNDATPFYPASYQPSPDTVIAVAATDRHDKFASWSNYGAKSVDLAAPGVDIYSTAPNNSYKTLSGTSMAAPHVAGAAALVWSADPSLTASQVKDRILAGTDYIGDKNSSRPTVTNGRLNAYKALPQSSGGGLTISISDVSITEGNSGSANAVFTVSLSQPAPAGGVSVEFGSADGTAKAGSDYVATSGVLSLLEGASSGTVTVAVNGDTLVEPNETFFLNLTNATNATIADGQGTGTIVNDDGIGSDAVYGAREEGFRSIDLVPGAAGVTTLLSSGDNKTVHVGIGSNTFNFYGASYSSFYVSTNGLITFGSGNNSYSNSDLTSSPSQPSIAPLWDDWIHTKGNAMILGKYQDVDGVGGPEVVIEWNNVQGYRSSQPVTFQVILWLNTGTTPSDFAFNYPDLDAGNFRSNGGSATVGIKDSGSQGSHRILVSYNSSTSPYVGSGKAIRFSPLSSGSTASLAAAGGQDERLLQNVSLASARQAQGPALPWSGTSTEIAMPLPQQRSNVGIPLLQAPNVGTRLLEARAVDAVFASESEFRQSGSQADDLEGLLLAPFDAIEELLKS